MMATKASASAKSSPMPKTPTQLNDPEHEAELFTLRPKADTQFSIKKKLALLTPPRLNDQFDKEVLRQVKSMTSDYALELLKAVLGVISCPIVYDEDCLNKFVKTDCAQLKRIMVKFLDPLTLDTAFKEGLRKEQHLIHAFEEEISLFASGNHPHWRAEDFTDENAFNKWKLHRMNALQRRLKVLKQIPPYSGTIQIHVVEAKGLPFKDPAIRSPADAYVQVRVNTTKFKTEYKEKTCDPVWNQVFDFTVVHPVGRVAFKVFDKKYLGSTFCGRVEIPLEDLMYKNMPIDKWYELQPHDATYPGCAISGRIHVRISYQYRIGPARTKPEDPQEIAPIPNAHDLYATILHMLYADHIQHPTTESESDPASQLPTPAQSEDTTPMSTPGKPIPARSRLQQEFAPQKKLSDGRLNTRVVMTSLNITPGAPKRNSLNLSESDHDSSGGSDNGSNGSNGEQTIAVSTPDTPPSHNGNGSFLTGQHKHRRQRSDGGAGEFLFAIQDGNHSPRSKSARFGVPSAPTGWNPSHSRQSSLGKGGSASLTAAMLNENSIAAALSAPQTPIDPATYKLPREYQWLLENFAKRYVISRMHTQLLMLEMLTRSFATTRTHIELIHQSVLEMESTKLTEKMVWRREILLYDTITDSLRESLNDCVVNYFVRFPFNDPPGAIALAAILYSVFTTKDCDQLAQVTTECIQTGMTRLFKLIVNVEQPTEPELIEACKFVSHALDIDREQFKDVFPGVDLSAVGIKTYYSELLRKAVHTWLRTNPPMSSDTLILYNNLKRLTTKVQAMLRADGGDPDNLMNVQQLFQPFLQKWLDCFLRHVTVWIDSSIKEEEWKAVSIASRGLFSTSENGVSGVYHSASAQELFYTIHQAYSQYREFDNRTEDDFRQLSEIIEKALSRYVTSLSRIVENALKSGHDPSVEEDTTPFGHSRSRSGSIDYSITMLHIVPSALGVWLSNIQFCSQRLYDFCAKTESDNERGGDTARQQFNDAFALFQQAEDQLIDSVVLRLNDDPSMQAALDKFLQDAPDPNCTAPDSDEAFEARVSALTYFLGNNMKVVVGCVAQATLSAILSTLWQCIVHDLEVMVFPITHFGKADPNGASLVKRGLPLLQDFMKKIQRGAITEKQMQRQAVQLTAAIELFEMTTPALLKLFGEQANGSGKSSNTVALDPFILAVLETRKGDKEAKKFVKAKKDATYERHILQEFELAPSEHIVQRYDCCKGPNLSGSLQLTTNFLCFDSYLWGDHRVKMQLKAIVAVRKDKRSSQNTLHISLRDGRSFQFHSFERLSRTAADIVAQAKKMGNVSVDLDVADSVDLPRKGSTIDSPSKKRASKISVDLPLSASAIPDEARMKALFDIPTDEISIASFSCSMSGSDKHATIYKGHLLLFRRHICFKSGSKIRERIGVEDIISIDRKNFAKVIPNAILVTSRRDKRSNLHLFSGFEERDAVFDILSDVFLKNAKKS